MRIHAFLMRASSTLNMLEVWDFLFSFSSTCCYPNCNRRGSASYAVAYFQAAYYGFLCFCTSYNLVPTLEIFSSETLAELLFSALLFKPLFLGLEKSFPNERLGPLSQLVSELVRQSRGFGLFLLLWSDLTGLRSTGPVSSFRYRTGGQLLVDIREGRRALSITISAGGGNHGGIWRAQQCYGHGRTSRSLVESSSIWVYVMVFLLWATK